MKFEFKNPKIYIVVGKARSGKNTVCQIIKEYYEKRGEKVIDLQYSTYIKKYAEKILNWDGSDQSKPREFLNEIGIELIKDRMYPHFTVHRMLEDLNVYSYFFDTITISDARFEEEIKMPLENFSNVKIIYVKRKVNPYKLSKESQMHRTNHGLDHYNRYDYILSNDNTISDLRREVLNILEEAEK